MLERMQHEQDVVDVTDETIAPRTIDPITGEPVFAREEDMPPPPETRIVERRVPTMPKVGARMSAMAILTGTLVTFGLAVIGTLGAGALNDPNLRDIAFVGTLLIASLWGGYTAGRMARTNGALHGVLVAAFTLGLGMLAAWGIRASAQTADVTLPFTNSVISIERDSIGGFSTALAIASLAALVAGSVVGGMRGSHWHRVVERRALES